jgi:hypothetical protein
VFPVDPRGLHWFEYFNDFSYGLQRFVLHDGIPSVKRDLLKPSIFVTKETYC